MRWLFHVRDEGGSRDGDYAPASLAREGFVHASFAGDVRESARLYFPAGARLEVLRIDPRRLPARVELAATPRGPMPHVHGPIPADAIRDVAGLEAFEEGQDDRARGARFGFVAFEGMTLLDLVSVHDPLARIRGMGVDESSSCEVVSATAPVVWADGGMKIEVDRVRPALDGFDVLVVPGGPGTRRLVLDASVVAWLATFPDNRLVASVCTGALLVGAMGRLRGRRATTHHTALGELARYGATAATDRVVDDGQVVTAGGVTSGLDLGIHLVRRLEGDAAADRIAAQMEWRASLGIEEK